MVRLQVALSMAEAEALGKWAISELRDPRDQIRLLLRDELRRRGLLGDGETEFQVHDKEEPEQGLPELEEVERE